MSKMDIDKAILQQIESKFMTAKELSDNLNESYGRIQVRLRQLRKWDMVVSLQTNNDKIKGVKPLKYKKKVIY